MNLLHALEEAMQGPKTACNELMGVARLFLKDNGIKATENDITRLQALHGLLVTKLLAAMEADEAPSSTTLETLRRFLADNNVSVDAHSTLELRKGLEQLSDLSLPFTKQ